MLRWEFTTEEAEYAVSTAEHREVVKALVQLGSVGFLSVIASLVLSRTITVGIAETAMI